MIAKEICPDEVRQDFEYDPKTGLLTWKNRKAGRPSSRKAGGLCDTGYLRVFWKGSKFRVHRIAWVHFYGEDIPNDLVIDHINRDKTDNRIENLRLVAQEVNASNRDKPKSLTHVLPGIKRHKKGWRIVVYSKGIRKQRGERSLFCHAVKRKRELLRGGLLGPSEAPNPLMR